MIGFCEKRKKKKGVGDDKRGMKYIKRVGELGVRKLCGVIYLRR